MATIIAGRFDDTARADETLEDLRREGFDGREVDSFYVPPPGQRGMLPAGGDVHADAGARGGGAGAAIGAVVGGAIGAGLGVLAASGLPTAEPVAIVALAAVGAWLGALAGALRRFHGPRPEEADARHPIEPPSGRVVAVLVERPGVEPKAVSTLRRHGAREIGRAHGEWSEGSWRDFDPRVPLEPCPR